MLSKLYWLLDLLFEIITYASILEVGGVVTPKSLGWGSWGQQGVVGDRKWVEILLYVITHSKNVA